MRLAYYVLHYGKEYLAWSIRSIQDAVDEIAILYTPTPSFGFRGDVLNPDTEEELKAQALRFANKTVRWLPGTWGSEGLHRKAGLDLAREMGASTVLVVDGDEIWDPETLAASLALIEEQNRAGRWMCRFANFFRSWRYMVHDQFTPVRIVDLRHPLDADAYLEFQACPIYHFGYAQCEATMRYKWSCHGHQAELRPGWLEKFIAWHPEAEDLHPCVNNLWQRAEPTPPEVLAKICELMGDHPYRDLEIIR
jgi:hypothetical protein